MLGEEVDATKEAKEGVLYLLLNNIEIDVKVKCIEENTSQAKIAEEAGTSAQYVSRLINNSEKIVNKTFVSIMEKLGYDIELTYVRRNQLK